MKIIQIFTLFLFTKCSYSQIARIGLNNHIVYYSLKDAEQVNPDSVFVLDLGNNGINQFPMNILKFKNLWYLTLKYRNIGEIYEATPSLLSKKETDEVIEIFKIHPKVRTDVDGLFPTYNKNMINNVPIEITLLKKLEALYFDIRFFSKKKIRKLKRLLPNCDVRSGY